MRHKHDMFYGRTMVDLSEYYRVCFFSNCFTPEKVTLSYHEAVRHIETMVWYGNSLFDITEKYIVIAKYLIKYMIYVWRLHK